MPPSYYTKPYVSTTRRIIKGRFDIYELNGYEHNHICVINTYGNRDLFNDILKRGIPYDDAKKLFYEMTT